MVSLVDDFSQYQFVIAQAPSQTKEFYLQFTENKNIPIINNATYDLLSVCELVVVSNSKTNYYLRFHFFG